MLRRSIENLELHKRNLRLFFITLVSLLIFFTISYAGRQIERAQVQAEAALWTQRIADARSHEAELTEQLAYVKSNAYVDQVAREQLGMAQPGDSVVILVTSEAQDATAPGGSTLAVDSSSNSLPSADPASPAWWKRIRQLLGMPSSP